MIKVLVVSTSRKTRGGITAVLKLYEQSTMWKNYRCRWIGTHRDGNSLRKMWYMVKGAIMYVLLLPFYDIVHFHISLETTVVRKYPLFRLAKCLGKKTIIHLHCGSQIDGIWNNRYQYMFNHCDCGIVLSESIKHKVEEYIGRTDKIKVVYNPCPIITNKTMYDKRDVILFSGTLYEGKGYRDLIKAFAFVANKYPDWKIVLAGNGETEIAKAMAVQLGIEQQVELLGWIRGEDKHRVFSEAKALCLPSYAEGFPMAVLDAWAYGLPVITTPVGGVADIGVDGVNMLLFKPGDVDALANQLERIITNKGLRLLLSKQSERTAEEKFNINVIANQVSRIYDSLLY